MCDNYFNPLCLKNYNQREHELLFLLAFVYFLFHCFLKVKSCAELLLFL
uniref:Uncharacterized protein n=1 Tax=Rhizophora mucronata TaxID=61149 RepID=A0A2P2IWL0_RHIMU